MSEAKILRKRLKYAVWAYFEETGGDTPWLTAEGEFSHPELFDDDSITETGEPTLEADRREG